MVAAADAPEAAGAAGLVCDVLLPVVEQALSPTTATNATVTISDRNVTI